MYEYTPDSLRINYFFILTNIKRIANTIITKVLKILLITIINNNNN